MYALPADFDPVVLVGRTLDTTTFCVGSVHSHFDPPLTVSAYMLLEHRTSSDPRDVTIIDIPLTESGLMTLLQHALTFASVRGHSDLVLEFDDGQMLAFLESEAPYESYQTFIGDRRFVV